MEVIEHGQLTNNKITSRFQAKKGQKIHHKCAPYKSYNRLNNKIEIIIHKKKKKNHNIRPKAPWKFMRDLAMSNL